MRTEEMVELAASVARTYHRRLPLASYEDENNQSHWAPYEDLLQEALAAMLRAAKTYAAHPEGDERGYLYKSAVYAVHKMLHLSISPVSASSHNLDDLKGLVRAPVDWLAVTAVRPVRSENGVDVPIMHCAVAANSEPADEQLADRVWLKRVRERVHYLLGKEMEEPDAILACEVLFGYLTPGQTAKDASVPPRKVYAALRRARVLIGSDRVLYDLTKERSRK